MSTELQSLTKYCDLFQPRYPFILVERLPDNFNVGSIIIPGDDNKVLHEGVVLKVWEPFERQQGYLKLEHAEAIERLAKDETCEEYKNSNAQRIIRSAACTDDDAPPCMVCCAILASRQMSQNRGTYRHMKSEFEPGDHVVFPHYGGVEHPAHKDILYIRERNDEDRGGTVLGKIGHDRMDIAAEIGRVLSGGYMLKEHIVPTLLEHFVIVPKRSAHQGPTRS